MVVNRYKQYPSDIPTLTLNNITFFLFLFFVTISTFANPNIAKLNLTEAEFNETIDKNHSRLDDTREKLHSQNKNVVAIVSLEQELQAMIPASNIMIRIPADLPVQDLADEMQIAVKFNLNFVIKTTE